jgi:hypothetical protein
MKLLKHALSDSEMELALSCMDSHGYITPEQVCGVPDIIIRSGTSNAMLAFHGVMFGMCVV